MKAWLIILNITLITFSLACQYLNFNEEQFEVDIKSFFHDVEKAKVKGVEDGRVKVILEKDTYIFDKKFNDHKADLVTYIFRMYSDISANLRIEFWNDEELVYKGTRETMEVDSIFKAYKSDRKVVEAKKYIFNNFNAEEQWNTLNAMRSLKAEIDKFYTEDYIYLLDQVFLEDREKYCNHLWLLHHLILETGLENFWKDTEVRKDASTFTRKYNKLAAKINCRPVKDDEDFAFAIENFSQ